MPANHRPGHFVVDGSNIATEGRSIPSLAQLNEAVLAFAADHPDALLTVVVDATFGHRIDKSEVAEFDEAVANNELVAPPAGAVGRGDAFVLTIANKADAGVLSNDSFQEFHGQYEWLFDEGRLVGGKPVPYVGWVFVDRTPVRGPKSRQSVKAAQADNGRPAKRTTKAAKQPLATPEEAVAAKEMAKARIRPKASAAPGPSLDDSSSSASAASTGTRASRAKTKKAAAAPVSEASDGATAVNPSATGYVNALMPFLNFVEHHAVGTTCDGIIENYASHGAYATVGDIQVYLPLRLMGTPPPRSARSIVKVGDAVTMRIVGFVPERRSVDAALLTDVGDAANRGGQVSNPDSAVPDPASTTATAKSPARRRSTKSASATTDTPDRPSNDRSAPRPRRARGGLKATQLTDTARIDTGRIDTGRIDTGRIDTGRIDTGRIDTGNGAVASPSEPVQEAAPKKAVAKKAAAKKTVAKKAAAKKTVAKKAAAADADAKKETTKEWAPMVDASKAESNEAAMLDSDVGPSPSEPAKRVAASRTKSSAKSPASATRKKTGGADPVGTVGAAKAAPKSTRKSAGKRAAVPKTSAPMVDESSPAAPVSPASN